MVRAELPGSANGTRMLSFGIKLVHSLSSVNHLTGGLCPVGKLNRLMLGSMSTDLSGMGFQPESSSSEVPKRWSSSGCNRGCEHPYRDLWCSSTQAEKKSIVP